MNMVEMKDDEKVFMRGVWVSFEHKRINEIFKLKDLKHGSKLKKMVDNPNYDKILNMLLGKENGRRQRKTHTMPSTGGPSQKKPKYGFTSSARSSSQQNICAQ